VGGPPVARCRGGRVGVCGAPAGAVGLAISRVLRNGVDRLHAPLRTSSDRTVWEAMDGVVKVVKELRRATFMEDDIGRIVS